MKFVDYFVMSFGELNETFKRETTNHQNKQFSEFVDRILNIYCRWYFNQVTHGNEQKTDLFRICSQC